MPRVGEVCVRRRGVRAQKSPHDAAPHDAAPAQHRAIHAPVVSCSLRAVQAPRLRGRAAKGRRPVGARARRALGTSRRPRLTQAWRGAERRMCSRVPRWFVWLKKDCGAAAAAKRARSLQKLGHAGACAANAPKFRGHALVAPHCTRIASVALYCCDRAALLGRRGARSIAPRSIAAVRPRRTPHTHATPRTHADSGA